MKPGELLLSVAKKIQDPRIERTKLHNLAEMIVIAIYSNIAGANGWQEIEVLAKDRLQYLKKFLELKNGIPSHDTFERVFARIHPALLGDVLTEWAQALSGNTGRVIAIDGKTLRHSFDNANKKTALHTISAYVTNQGITLANLEVDEKTNEITAIPKLLNMMDVKGDTITIDAIGCQKNIAQHIINDKKANYVIAVKGNQPSLHNEIVELFDALDKKQLRCEPSFYQTTEKGHGRYETRSCLCLNASMLCESEFWTGIKTVARISTLTELNGTQRFEKRYFISSLPTKAENILSSVRNHWQIENSVHWVLDVVFNEDASRIRKNNAPANFSHFRRMALTFIKQNKPKNDSIKRARYKAAISEDFANLLFMGN